MKIPPHILRKYLRNPNVCPTCGDSYIEGYDDRMLSHVHCRKCGSTWTDVYDVVDVRDFEPTVAVPTKPHMTHAERKAFNRERWMSWDWNKPNIEVAIERGLTWQRVAQIRRMLDIPNPFKHPQKATHRAEWVTWDWNKTDSMLAREHSVCRERIRQIRLEIGAPVSPAKHRVHGEWALMNFDLSNNHLQEIWNMPDNAVASYRSRNQINPPKYDARRTLSDGERKELMVLLGQEKLKAQEYHAKETRTKPAQTGQKTAPQ